MTIGSNIIPDKLISKTTSKKNIKNKKIQEVQEVQENKEVKEYKKRSRLSKFDWENMDKKNFALIPGLYEKIKDYAWKNRLNLTEAINKILQNGLKVK